MQLKLIISILMILALSACAPKQLQPTYRHILPSVRQTQLTAINNWEISGSFSLRQAGQSVVANYQWVQQAAYYDLHLSSPLNLFSVKIIGSPEQVSLWRSASVVSIARDPEELMQQQLGWQLPVSNLQYWIRGLPAPGPYQAHYDSYGHLVELEQAGWLVHYAGYISRGPNDLPTLLKLNSADWAAKILIKRWVLS